MATHFRSAFSALRMDVDLKARAEGINWIIDVHNNMDIDPDTLFRAVTLMDQYLQASIVDQRTMQLLSAAALYVAASHIEIESPEWRHWFFAVITRNGAITEAAILRMEKEILAVVSRSLALQGPLQTLRFDCRDVEATREEDFAARYILELCLVDYVMASVSPSAQAAAAVYCALQLSGRPKNCPKREAPYYSCSRREFLRPLVQRMAGLFLEAPGVRNLAPYKKYKSERYHSVACLSEAKTWKLRLMAEGILTFGGQ